MAAIKNGAELHYIKDYGSKGTSRLIAVVQPEICAGCFTLFSF